MCTGHCTTSSQKASYPKIVRTITCSGNLRTLIAGHSQLGDLTQNPGEFDLFTIGSGDTDFRQKMMRSGTSLGKPP